MQLGESWLDDAAHVAALLMLAAALWRWGRSLMESVRQWRELALLQYAADAEPDVRPISPIDTDAWRTAAFLMFKDGFLDPGFAPDAQVRLSHRKAYSRATITEKGRHKLQGSPTPAFIHRWVIRRALARWETERQSRLNEGGGQPAMHIRKPRRRVRRSRDRWLGRRSRDRWLGRNCAAPPAPKRNGAMAGGVRCATRRR